MNSRNWKLLVLAPLTLTFLAACADRDKKGDPASPFAGTWLRKSAWADYNESISNPTTFCQAVYQSPQNHGINTRNGTVGNVAWRISDSGEVYHWTPSVRYEHVSSKSYSVGNVAADGSFVIQAPVAGRNAYQFEARVANPYSRLYAVDAGRLNFARYDGRIERYVRVSLRELQTYSNRLTECGTGIRFSEYSYGTDADDFADGPNSFQGPMQSGPAQSPYSSGGQPAQRLAPGVPAPESPDNGQYPPPDFERPDAGARGVIGSPYARNQDYEPLTALPSRRR